jgi:hypothetical protein
MQFQLCTTDKQRRDKGNENRISGEIFFNTRFYYASCKITFSIIICSRKDMAATLISVNGER